VVYPGILRCENSGIPVVEGCTTVVIPVWEKCTTVGIPQSGVYRELYLRVCKVYPGVYPRWCIYGDTLVVYPRWCIYGDTLVVCLPMYMVGVPLLVYASLLHPGYTTVLTPSAACPLYH